MKFFWLTLLLCGTFVAPGKAAVFLEGNPNEVTAKVIQVGDGKSTIFGLDFGEPIILKAAIESADHHGNLSAAFVKKAESDYALITDLEVGVEKYANYLLKLVDHKIRVKGVFWTKIGTDAKPKVAFTLSGSWQYVQTAKD